MLSRTSFDAASRSAPQSNSRMIIEIFSEVLDVIALRLLTVPNDVSSGSVTIVSISSGPAPG